MNNYRKIINKTNLITVWSILTVVCLIVRILKYFNIISSEAAITGIISPIFCLILSTIIQVATENTQSNEKLKLALERLKRNRKYNCKNKNNEMVNWYSSLNYDKEYKFITKNRWESDKKIKEQMKKDKYWDEKFSQDAKNMNITKEEALNSWIEDHFIY